MTIRIDYRLVVRHAKRIEAEEIKRHGKSHVHTTISNQLKLHEVEGDSQFVRVSPYWKMEMREKYHAYKKQNPLRQCITELN